MSLRLAPAGIERDEREEGPDGMWHDVVRCVRPQSIVPLLRLWHEVLEEITPDFTFGHLIDLLGEMDESSLGLLGEMCHLDLPGLIAASRRPRMPDPDDEGELRTRTTIEYLEVTTHAELSVYEKAPGEDEDEPIEEISAEEADAEDAVAGAVADVIGEPKPFQLRIDTGENDPISGEPVLKGLRIPRSTGTWKPPYLIYHDFHGWGPIGEPYEGAEDDGHWHPDTRGGISVSLTPVQNLRDYPLRYKGDVTFRSRLYDGDELLTTSLSIRLGEFIQAIFWDLGFHGGEDDKAEFLGALIERVEEIKAARPDEV